MNKEEMRYNSARKYYERNLSDRPWETVLACYEVVWNTIDNGYLKMRNCEVHEYASKFLELHEKYCPNSVVTPTGGKFSDHSAYIKFRMDEMQSYVILNGYPVPVKDFYNKFMPCYEAFTYIIADMKDNGLFDGTEENEYNFHAEFINWN